MSTISGILAIAAGGAIGACSRYLTGQIFLSLFGSGFPWGTLTVNVIGSFLIGYLTRSPLLQGMLPSEIGLMLTVGVLGGYTTFSTFALESLVMIERGQVLQGSLYIGASLFCSFAACLVGLHLGKAL